MDKELLTQALNYYLSLATIVGGVVTLIFGIYVFYKVIKGGESKLLQHIANYALPIGFFASLLGTILSLFYSDYLGVLPCGLCWFQRIFLYPQVILYAMAWMRRDFGIYIYTFVLSLIGLVIAIYHSSLQWGYSEFIPCPVIASTIDCAKPSFVEFGFVTFPFMAFVLFVFLTTLATVGINIACHQKKVA
jgi:disulfide bond formation protein DsbB